MCSLFKTLFLTIFFPSSISTQSFNLSTAKCFDPTSVGDVNLYQEWRAYQENGSDGYCYDSKGVGYKPGHTSLSCGGCIVYVCASHLCGGGEYQLYWEVSSISKECCQNCQGAIFPSNTVVSRVRYRDSCQTVQLAMCRSGPGSLGTIAVSFKTNNCCQDQNSVLPVGTTKLEKETCSVRTCARGRPAHWQRSIQYTGGCGCCEYNSTLVLPGDCLDMPGGYEGCCCDGQLVRTVKMVTMHLTPAFRPPILRPLLPSKELRKEEEDPVVELQ